MFNNITLLTTKNKYIIKCIKASQTNDLYLDAEQALCKEIRILDLPFISTADESNATPASKARQLQRL